MLKRDQAEQIADSILEPSRQAQAERQERFAKRKGWRKSALFPAIVAAVATYLALDAGLPPSWSLVLGTLSGYVVGLILGRPQQTS